MHVRFHLSFRRWYSACAQAKRFDEFVRVTEAFYEVCFDAEP